MLFHIVLPFIVWLSIIIGWIPLCGFAALLVYINISGKGSSDEMLQHTLNWIKENIRLENESLESLIHEQTSCKNKLRVLEEIEEFHRKKHFKEKGKIK